MNKDMHKLSKPTTFQRDQHEWKHARIDNRQSEKLARLVSPIEHVSVECFTSVIVWARQKEKGQQINFNRL